MPGKWYETSLTPNDNVPVNGRQANSVDDADVGQQNNILARHLITDSQAMYIRRIWDGKVQEKEYRRDDLDSSCPEGASWSTLVHINASV